MKRYVLVVTTVMFLALTACGSSAQRVDDTGLASVPSGYAGLVNPLGAEAVNDGAKVFKSNCQTCHGPEGHGDGPASQALDPQPKNLAELQARAGDDYLFWRISTGREGTSMVAWKGVLTEEQIWQVIAFVNTLK